LASFSSIPSEDCVISYSNAFVPDAAPSALSPFIPASGAVDALPRIPDLATRLLRASSRLNRALGDSDRAFERHDHLDHGNITGDAREAVAALGSALRDQQARSGQRLEDLAHDGRGKLGVLGQLAGVVRGVVSALGEMSHDDDSIVCEAADSEHDLPACGL
jgi:hypothetical protein